ncbi:DnaJ subfamily B member 5 [Carex littledalei]|uniref:DnaJ subfamily B member 5 n=1 Tax=Carex littledalei TaxID=544730 RepID=A0A833RLA4_9POAL|nr:DnaJ subfamily B member 5 [Carex littledalei]
MEKAEEKNIPIKFAKMFVMSENIELEGPSGYTWHVKIMRSESDNTFALQSGWKEFVTDNKIYENDILVFTYKDNSSFKVLIFDRSGCEKVAPFFAKNMNTEPGKESEESNDSSIREIAYTDERVCGKRKQRDFVQESSEGDSESDDGTVRKRKTKENRAKKASRPSYTQIRRGPPPAASTGTGTTTGKAGCNGSGTNQTFSTICQSCSMYDRTILKKALRCQNCLKPFIAYDMNEQVMPSGTGTGNGVKPNPNSRPNPSNGPTSAGPALVPLPMVIRNLKRSIFGNGQKGGSRLKSGPGTSAGTNVLPVQSNKRKRKFVIEEEEESDDSTDSSDGKDEIILEPQAQSNEKADRDDDLDDDMDNVNNDMDDDKEEEAEADLNSEPKEYTYPDPEFFQFDNLRDPTQFAVDQVWAVYDDRDGMPRFYARIKAVRTVPTFEIDIAWFEPDPDPFTQTWTRKGLPVATGAFKLGKTLCVDELLMFSHALSCNKVGKRNAFYIYPKKGEIWAMFKDWNFNWCSESGKKKKFDYEMVEVVSDLTDGTGFIVMPLVKINGFVSLFMQSREAAPVVIPKNEILRFSHNVPWYRTTGNERERVPQGAFELDSVSLPPDLDKAFSCIDLDPKLNEKSKEEKREDHAKSDKISSKEEKKEEREDHARSEGDYMAYEYPASEFYNFRNDRSIEKFKPGQTWALYSDPDKLPKYYAVVKRVDPEKKTVYITWLEPYNKDATGEEKRWIDTNLPLGCGTFRFGGKARYNNTDVFSHEVVNAVSSKMNVYEIVPAKTETWAVYKNWKIGWSMNDITKTCQYDLVRVSNVTRTWIEVLYLAKVAGHKTVFKLDHERKVMRIPKGEFVRFAHKIPAHRLSDKAGPNLSGCWELDPAALPESLLF